MCFSECCNNSWPSAHCEKHIWSRNFCCSMPMDTHWFLWEVKELILILHLGIKSRLRHLAPYKSDLAFTQPSVQVNIITAQKRGTKEQILNLRWMARIISRQLEMSGLQMELWCSWILWPGTSVGRPRLWGKSERCSWTNAPDAIYLDVHSWHKR